MGMIGPGRIGYGGTYNGNSMCLAAAKATLRELTRNDDEAFRHMHTIGARIMEGLGELMERYDHEGSFKVSDRCSKSLHQRTEDNGVSTDPQCEHREVQGIS